MDLRRALTVGSAVAVALGALRLAACGSNPGATPSAAGGAGGGQAAGTAGRAGKAGTGTVAGAGGEAGLAWATGNEGWEPIPIFNPKPGCPVDRAVGDIPAPGFTWTSCGEGCERDDARWMGAFRNVIVRSYAPLLTDHLGVIRIERDGILGEWTITWMVDPATNETLGAVRSKSNATCIRANPDTAGIVRFYDPEAEEDPTNAIVLQAKGGMTKAFHTVAWGLDWTDGESVFLLGDVQRYGLDGSKPVALGASIDGFMAAWGGDLVMTSAWGSTSLFALVNNTPPTVKVDMSAQIELSETVGYVGLSDDKMVVPFVGWEGEYQKSPPTHRRFWIADRKPLGANPTVSPKFPTFLGGSSPSFSAGDFTGVMDYAIDGFKQFSKVFVLRRTDMKYFQVPMVESGQVFGLTPTHIYLRDETEINGKVLGLTRFDLSKIDVWGIPVPALAGQ